MARFERGLEAVRSQRGANLPVVANGRSHSAYDLDGRTNLDHSCTSNVLRQPRQCSAAAWSRARD